MVGERGGEQRRKEKKNKIEAKNVIKAIEEVPVRNRGVVRSPPFQYLLQRVVIEEQEDEGCDRCARLKLVEVVRKVHNSCLKIREENERRDEC